jgi:hypothetical protein
LIDNYIQNIESKNYKINYTYKEKSFLFYKNSITFHNIYIENLSVANKNNEQNDSRGKNSNLKAKKMILNFGIFSIFTGDIQSVDLISADMNFYQSNMKNLDDFKLVFKNLNGNFNIKDSNLYIYNENFIVSKVFNSIGGSIESSSGKMKISMNFAESGEYFEIKASLNKKFFDSEWYETEVKILSNDEKFVYSGVLDFNGQKINKIQSKVEASGEKLEKILRLFCWSDRFQQNSESNSNGEKEKFILNATINYENDLLKISDIRYEKNDIKASGVISYINSKDRLYINLDVDALKVSNSNVDFNLFALKNQILSDGSNQLSWFAQYYGLIGNRNYNLDLKIGKILLFNDHIINDVDLTISSENKKTIIKKLNGRLDGKYNISTLGEILSNGIREHLRLRVLIPLEKKKEKIDFIFSYLDGYASLSNINVVSGDLMISGKANFSMNEKINFASGELSVMNYNISNFLKNFDNFFRNEGDDKNGVLTNSLLLLNKAKINSDLKINFKDSIVNGNKIENLFFAIKNDEKRINIVSELKDKKFFSLKNRYELHLNELRPQLVISTNGDSLNIKNLLKLFRVKDDFVKNYFFFSDEELRKKPDKVILKDVNLNFEKLQNVNFSLNGLIRDVIYDDMKIDEVNCSIKAENNVVKIDNLSSKIEHGKIDLQGNFNLENNSLASQIKIDSINFNNFFEKKRDKPIFLSATGKIFSSGDTVISFVKNALGRFEYLSYNYYIENLDLNLFVKNAHALNNYSDLISLAERSVVSGETVFNEVKGSFDINDGIFSTNFQFSSDIFTGAGILNISGQTSIFKGLTRIAFIPIHYTNVVYADLDWSGNLYNTNKAFDVEKLRGLINQR